MSCAISFGQSVMGCVNTIPWGCVVPPQTKTGKPKILHWYFWPLFYFISTCFPLQSIHHCDRVSLCWMLEEKWRILSLYRPSASVSWTSHPSALLFLVLFRGFPQNIGKLILSYYSICHCYHRFIITHEEIIMGFKGNAQVRTTPETYQCTG